MRCRRQRTSTVASFYAEANGVFGSFLRRLLKICIQIKWICQMKRDSLTSLVHNNLFHSLVTTTGCIFLSWIQWYYWKFSTTINKDLYSNKVNDVKQKNKKTKIPRSFASRNVRLYKLSQKLWNKFLFLLSLSIMI